MGFGFLNLRSLRQKALKTHVGSTSAVSLTQAHHVFTVEAYSSFTLLSFLFSLYTDLSLCLHSCL